MINEDNSSSFDVNNTDFPIVLNQLSKKKNSIEETKNEYERAKIKEPLEKYKSQVVPLEKELFENLNLEWGVDIISEDIPLTENKKCYCHLIRTANPDINKNNFILIHGFISSGMHYLGVIPYLIKRYNIFIPDTIGMGMSARPQVEFTSPMQCEDYFIKFYHVIIEYIFFQKNYNVKEEYYLCGHSLGGFIASRYMLKYPKGIKKVLLLSPCGITDYHIKGTNMDANATCLYCCMFKTFPSCLAPCQIGLRNIYRCCCCLRGSIKNYYEDDVKFDENEIKKNKDGTPFVLNKKKISSILGQLGILALKYPKDLSHCAYHIFTVPPIGCILPIENKMKRVNRKETIIVFGETDFMDREGSYRLQNYNPKLYKVYSVKNGGHSFSLENPEELCKIISQHFEE